MNTNVIDQTAEKQGQDALALTFKAMAHPARLAILEMLREDEACVCHLEAALGFRQAYISQQLAVLRDANLVQSRQDGWNIYYSLTDDKLPALVDAFYAALLPGQRTEVIKNPPDCPCPRCNPAPQS